METDAALLDGPSLADKDDVVRVVGAVAEVVSFGELEGVAPVCLDNDAREEVLIFEVASGLHRLVPEEEATRAEPLEVTAKDDARDEFGLLADNKDALNALTVVAALPSEDVKVDDASWVTCCDGPSVAVAARYESAFEAAVALAKDEPFEAVADENEGAD